MAIKLYTVAIEIKKVYGPGANIHRSYGIKAQNRIYEDSRLNLHCVLGHTKTVDLSLLGLYLNNGLLIIDVNSVTE